MKSTKKQVKPLLASLFALNNIHIRVMCLILTLIIAFSLTSCEKNDYETTENESTTAVYSLPQDSIKIGYSAEDSLNPFMAKTSINTSHSSLVYQSLFTLDKRFTAANELVEFSNLEQNTLTVILTTGLLFSDGSVMTAHDVVYSFECAKQSPLYSEKLVNFESAKATGEYEIKFVLTKYDNYCRNLLDFPIVRTASADKKEDLPTGSGLYMYRFDGENRLLIHNKYSKKPLPSIGTIELLDIKDSSTLAYALETGEIDVYYTDLNTRKLSRVYAATIPVYLNNLVYLGYNTVNNYTLSFSAVRRAISLAINRADICGTAYSGYADAAYTLFNPNWAGFTSSAIDTSVFAVDYSKSVSTLEDAGFTNIYESGIRSGTHGTLSYKLIVNKENEYRLAAADEISKSLAKVGIRINIHELSWEDYKTALENNDYDLYLGEIKISANMDFSAFFTANGKASYGIAQDGAAVNSFNEYVGGILSMEAFHIEFQENMPIAPLCYRKGLLIVSRDIGGNLSSLPDNAYASIYDWTLKAPEAETSGETEESGTYSDIIM